MDEKVKLLSTTTAYRPEKSLSAQWILWIARRGSPFFPPSSTTILFPG